VNWGAEKEQGSWISRQGLASALSPFLRAQER